MQRCVRIVQSNRVTSMFRNTMRGVAKMVVRAMSDVLDRSF